MRWLMLIPLLVGCATFDQHTMLVQFRDPRVVEVHTLAPDGTHGLLAGGEARQVAAGGGVFHLPTDNTRASYTVGLRRDADGTTVMHWDTGLSLATGNEFELVRPDGQLPEIAGSARSTVGPHAKDPSSFHRYMCVSPGGISSRYHSLTYRLAATGERDDDPETLSCASGIAVEVTTPWSNVVSVRDRVDTTSPLTSILLLVNGLPFLISGLLIRGEPDTQPLSSIFITVGALVTAAAIPGLFHWGHTDTLYPTQAP